MAKVLLGVTGSVAAIRTPELRQALLDVGHAVRIVATRASLYFFNPDPLGDSLVLDEHEWPGMAEGRRFQRDDPVLHIELRRWADVLMIAPLDANTLSKLAAGIADNCLTCVCRCWPVEKPLLLAPAMNTLMWEHPQTRRHLRQLAADRGVEPPASVTDLGELVAAINVAAGSLRIVAPISKKLACGDVGVGGLAPASDLLAVLATVAG